MKAPHLRIGFLSLSLITPRLSSRSWPSFVVIFPPDLFDGSDKFYYPEKQRDKTVTLSLSVDEVFELQVHNPLPEPVDFAICAKQFARIEERFVVPCAPVFPRIKGFVSSRPPRLLGVGGKKHKKVNRQRRR